MRKIVEPRVGKYCQPSHPLYFRMDQDERDRLTAKLTAKIVETEVQKQRSREEGGGGKAKSKMDREKVVLKVKKYVQSWFQKKKEERKKKRKR